MAHDPCTDIPELTTGPLLLDMPEAARPDVTGMKAARLADLVRAGFVVPRGAILPRAMCARRDEDEIRKAVESITFMLGDGPFAVRSSAVEEDLADASYAGMYETVLDVVGVEQVVAAALAVIASGHSDRPSAYGRGEMSPPAVLIQVMVDADSAGVAFTADPLTGDRASTIVVAVAGVGERLVSGEDTGEQWTVVDGVTSGPVGATILDERRAGEVAALARRVEQLAGPPQDIEWGFAGSTLHLLQARPMTALPEVVRWDPPGGEGYYRSDFRIGEWLHGPVTTLFGSWFLPRYDTGLDQAFRRYLGISFRLPMHTIVNGWYFTGMVMEPLGFLRMLRRPARAFKYFGAIRKIGRDPTAIGRDLAGPALAWYRETLEPEILASMAAAELEVADASPHRLVEMVDDLAYAAGLQAFALIVPAGAAWKIEYSFARFCRDNLSGDLTDGHELLLAGLTEPRPVPPHAVTTLDWSEPTLAELGIEPGAPSAERHRQLRDTRERAEQRCRQALAGDAKTLAAFDSFLEVSQRYAIIREELVRDLTATWPVMRRAIDRLGRHAAEVGAISEPTDVYHLTRSELEDVAAGHPVDLRSTVAARRRELAERSRLVPPKSIGKASASWRPILQSMDGFATLRSKPSTGLSGVGASPGRATGPVRVVRGPADFALVQPGDVLVARATAPAWTPLFSKVVAIVTDSGSVAAHASLIAREYGIPAVVGTGDATSRLRTGTVVLVDGGKGSVEIIGS